MSAVAIPTDFHAERAVIGCCLISRAGARLAHQRLHEGAFYDRRCARVFTASVDPRVDEADDQHRPNSDAAQEARISTIADLTNVWWSWLWDVAGDCPVAVDVSGSWAKRVLVAAEQRRLMAVAVELHEAASRGDKKTIARLTQDVARAA